MACQVGEVQMQGLSSGAQEVLRAQVRAGSMSSFLSGEMARRLDGEILQMTCSCVGMNVSPSSRSFKETALLDRWGLTLLASPDLPAACCPTAAHADIQSSALQLLESKGTPQQTKAGDE